MRVPTSFVESKEHQTDERTNLGVNVHREHMKLRALESAYHAGDIETILAINEQGFCHASFRQNPMRCLIDSETLRRLHSISARAPLVCRNAFH